MINTCMTFWFLRKIMVNFLKLSLKMAALRYVFLNKGSELLQFCSFQKCYFWKFSYLLVNRHQLQQFLSIFWKFQKWRLWELHKLCHFQNDTFEKCQIFVNNTIDIIPMIFLDFQKISKVTLLKTTKVLYQQKFRTSLYYIWWKLAPSFFSDQSLSL